MQKKARYPLYVPLLAGVALLGVALLLILMVARNELANRAQGENGAPIITSGQAAVGGPFSLLDPNGQTVNDTDFRGRHMLVYFGFTYCPAICPTRLQVMSGAMDALGEKAAQVQPLFITIDPERDTPEVMGAYIQQFHPDLIGLTGTKEQIHAVAQEEYKVYYAKVDDQGSAGGYTMDHLDAIFLMGPDGEFVTFFPPGTLPEQIAARIEQTINGK